MTKCKIYKGVLPVLIAVGTLVQFAVPVSAERMTVSETNSLIQTQSIGQESISPYYENLIKINVDLNISNSGYATCIGNVNATIGCTCNVTLELQQKSGSSWRTIKEWTSSGRTNGFNEHWTLKGGYTYRLKLSADVYKSGQLVEQPRVYSNTVSY